MSPAPYEVLVGGGLLENLEDRLERAGLRGPFLVVSQPRIHKILARRLPRRLPVLLIPDGERAKSLSTLSRILHRAAELRLTRESTLIAVGGGVVGDVTGFAASVYMRGIRVVQAPTTLLAQVDSSIGGKTGVNFREVKNLVGTFHQPALVLADTGTLQSLPAREYSSGLYEVLKYGVIRDTQLFGLFVSGRHAIVTRDPDVVERLVARSVAIKADIVAQDEREGGLRRILNFGHTIGHGLEAAAGLRRLKHGEAVGYGMIAATRISRSLARISGVAAERVEAAVDAIGTLPPLAGLRPKQVLDALRHDKKVKDGAVHFVLPRAIGAVDITPDVPWALVRETVERLIDERQRAR